jgi:integral membrane protein (TIGR01906 family)
MTNRIVRDGFVAAMTALVIVVLALLPLLTPWVMHPVLDAADSAAWLGTDAHTTHELSDRTVDELVFGPGTWQLAAADGSTVYDASEIAHLRDVRQLLWLAFLIAALALVTLLVVLQRSSDTEEVIAAIGLGGAVAAVGVVVLGVVGALAFDPLFELFHEVFFPQGDWAFDPGTQRLVQLYPLVFWQLMGLILGVLVVVLGVLTWLGAHVARRGRERVAW